MATSVQRLVSFLCTIAVLIVGGRLLLGADGQKNAASKSPAATSPGTTWSVGTPIVTYWSGPTLTDASAKQLVDGGWNLACCGSEEAMDVAHRNGLRAQFQHGLITPKTLDNPEQRKELDELIERVRRHPALYSYFITDEPNVSQFHDLARIVAYLREHDPEHIAYINLFPTNATNEQLGTQGDATTAYREHLRQYLQVVQPSLISYDHYSFGSRGDEEQYFLNLALIREASIESGLPFLNIVQACTWMPARRIPNGDEMRFLVYTSLAYGAQGISYYVYVAPAGHKGGIVLPDGTPTPLYNTLQSANREFVAIATEVQPLRCLGAYHAGMEPPGGAMLPTDAAFQLDPPVAEMKYQFWKPVQGMLLGFFGSAPKEGEPGRPSHAIVVNLDYKAGVSTTLVGPRNLEVFDAATRAWSKVDGARAALSLPPGGGKLVRLLDSTRSK